MREQIILQGRPISTNHLYDIACRGGRAIKYMNKKGKELKLYYSQSAKNQYRKEPTKELLFVEIELFFPDLRKRDIDNWHKIALDSLTGIVWIDDKQIEAMYTRKCIDKENPRIIINIKKMYE